MISKYVKTTYCNIQLVFSKNTQILFGHTNYVSNDDDFDVMMRALHYFSDYLLKLEKNEKNIPCRLSPLSEDISDHIEITTKIIHSLNENQIDDINHEHLEIIKNSLRFYQNELSKSKEIFKKELEVKFPNQKTDKEIKHIDRIFASRDW